VREKDWSTTTQTAAMFRYESYMNSLKKWSARNLRTAYL